MPFKYDPKKGFLHGIRVLQYTDEKGDYAGKLLQGLGADGVMVVPRLRTVALRMTWKSSPPRGTMIFSESSMTASPSRGLVGRL